jgi:hypothetical protein
MASQSLFFCKFEPTTSISQEMIQNLLLNSSTEDDRFVIKESGQDFIDGYFITYYISKEYVFNDSLLELVPVDVKKSSAIPFSIDLVTNRLDIWGSKHYATKLMTSLSLAMNNQMVMESVMLSFSEVLKRLELAQIDIVKIKVDNVLFESNIVATCTFNMGSSAEPYNIIRKYSDNITQISGSIKDINGESTAFTIYSSGRIMLYKTKEQLSSGLLDKIREICFGVR